MNNYGGFLRRLLAYVIDTLILYIPFIFIPKIDYYNVWLNILFLILWTAYFVWMVGTYGATVGKMVMKLKITKEDGKKVSYSDALLREIASYLSFIVFGLGYLNIIWDKRKQGWHDKIAKTIVIRV